MQNRLEHTMRSLATSAENLQSAESRLRDADMAKEMLKLAAAKVLEQSAISMLAQANQSHQSVLKILQEI
jgi:flagellin